MPEPSSGAEYARAKAELLALIELSPEAADGHLARLAGQSPDLAERVRRLLQAHREAGDFLDVPDEGRDGVDASPGFVGRRFGPFVVEREIGRGGMGTVLLGVRQEGGFTQRVAIKVISGTRLDARAVDRLRDERRILAALNHPWIAHFVDGGTTDDRMPYLAMEYVEGVPITTFCDEHALSVRDRVRLFQKVCEAVHYAHQRLVVHRDIKPSNILVTAAGTPKLLDFGIAKLLDPLAGDGTATVRVLTPRYASPEQASGAPVTTSTDVYSLGVLLYELLTGAGPYRSLSNDSSPLAVLDAIRQEEPERPRVAAARAGRVLHDDLDAILLKALRKAEADRYGSVEQLALDLTRFLDGRPVRARQGTAAYRARKFVARNRGAVVAATVATVGLVIAAAVSVWQARVAERERALADARFADVRRLANAVVGPLFDAIAKVPGSTEAQRLLVQEALDYLDRLATQASDDVDLKAELAAAYQKIGDVQGNLFGPNVGDAPGAKASYDKLLQLRRSIAAARPGDGAAQLALGEAEMHAADMALSQSRYADAAAGYERAVKLADTALAAAPSDAWLLFRSRSTGRLGIALNWAGRANDAIRAFDDSIRTVLPLAERPDAPESVQISLLSSRGNLGDVYFYQERFAEALEHYRAGLALARRVAATTKDQARGRQNVFLSAARVAAALNDLGRPDEAIPLWQECVTLQEERVRQDPRNVRARFDLAATYVSIAEVHLRRRDPAAARSSASKALDLMKGAFADSPDERSELFNHAMTYAVLGRAELGRGDARAAVTAFRRSLEISAAPDVQARKPSNRFEVFAYLGDALTAFASSAGDEAAARQADEAYRASRDGLAALAEKGTLLPSLAPRLADLNRKLRR